METKYTSKTLFFTLILIIFFTFVTSDLAKDREKCADQLVGLASCLPYVGGDAKTPTTECCSGLKKVLDTSKECLCILVKDRNDPSLGLKINATLALSLPDKCRKPASVSECPALLHLAPNSPDAKVFEDFAKSAKASNATSSAEVKGTPSGKTTSADVKSDGQRRSWLGMEMALMLMIITMTLHFLPLC